MPDTPDPAALLARAERAECEAEVGRMKLAACGVAVRGGSLVGLREVYDTVREIAQLRNERDALRTQHAALAAFARAVLAVIVGPKPTYLPLFANEIELLAEETGLVSVDKDEMVYNLVPWLAEGA